MRNIIEWDSQRLPFQSEGMHRVCARPFFAGPVLRIFQMGFFSFPAILEGMR